MNKPANKSSSSASNSLLVDDEDDFTSDFKANIQKIKEKKFKLAQISNYLSPSSQPAPIDAKSIKPSTSKYFGETVNKSDADGVSNSNSTGKECASFEYKPTKKFSRTESCGELSERRAEEKKAKLDAKREQQEQSEKEDLKAKVNESLLKDAVPNCPICSKSFHTFNQRQTHLKKCAQVFRIKTENLVELIKKQQQRIERDLSKGLVPSEVFIPQLKKKLGLPRNRSKKLDDTQVQLTSLGIFASGAKLPTNKKKSKLDIEPSKLVSLDEKAKSELILKRFELILSQKIVYYNQNSQRDDDKKSTTSLVTTKFSTANNYLWDKCKYFLESKENFYVQSFVESGRFYVTNRVFIEKPDERRFTDVTVINTQTAFLLADLNDASQRENMSIYYTQMSRLHTTTSGSQQQYSMTNASGFFFDSVHDDDYYDNNENKNTALSTSVNELVIDEKRKSTRGERESPANVEPIMTSPLKESPPTTSATSQVVKSTRDLFEETMREDDFAARHDDSTSGENSMTMQTNDDSNKTSPKLVKEANEMERQAIFIDETIMEDDDDDHEVKTNEKVKISDKNDVENVIMSPLRPVLQQEDAESNSIENNPASIATEDQTLDMAVLDEDDDHQNDEPIMDKTISQIKLVTSYEPGKINKKRKSIDVIELSDDDEDNGRFTDGFSRQRLDLILEEERIKKFKAAVDVIEISSPVREKQASDENLHQDTDDEHLNEQQLLSLLNKTTPNVDARKSFAVDGTPLASNFKDDVWENFGEDVHQECFQFESNDDDFKVATPASKKESPLTQKITNVESDESLANLSNNHESQKNSAAKRNEHEEKSAKNDNEDDFDVDEFIKNYRDKMAAAASAASAESAMSAAIDPIEAPDSPEVVNKSSSESAVLSEPEVLKRDEPPPRKNNLIAPSAIRHEVDTPVNNRILSTVRQQHVSQGNLTPMPNYQAMDTPNLKVELKRFGIKALPRRQAVLKLTEIYQYTHRHKLASLPRSHSFNNLNSIASSEKAMENTKTRETNELVRSNQTENTENTSKIKKMMKKTVSDLNLNTKLIGKNQCRVEMNCEEDNQPKLLRVANHQKKPPRAPTSKKPSKLTAAQQQRLQECTLDDKLLEMIEQEDENDDEEFSSPEKGLLLSGSQRARKKQSKILDENETRQFVWDYIRNEPNCYLSVLSYEPIDYEKFLAEIQAALNPRRVQNKVLMKCLDELCVTFTLKALNAKSFGSQRAKATSRHHPKN